MRIKIIIIFLLLFSPLLLKSETITTKNDTLVFSLEKSIEWALEHNEAIIAESDKVKEAESAILVARSGFFPKIEVQGSYTRLAELPSLKMAAPEYGTIQVPVFGPMGDTIGFTFVPGIIGADTMEFRMGSEENYLARASLTQPLFTWGKIANGYQISKLNLEAVKEDYRQKKNGLVFNVKQSFYAILVLREFVKVTEESYEQTKRHINVVKKRYNAGLASDFDLLRAEVQLKNMEPQLVKVKNELEVAEKSFKTLLGLSQDTPLKVEGKLKYEPFEVSLDSLISKAKANRPELKALSLRKKMAEKALSIAKKTNFPNLALIANYDYKKPLYFENEWGKDWNITIALQMPIFTGFENLGKKREAKERLSQTQHYLAMLNQMIELEVRSTYLKLREAEKLIESQKENVNQAEKALEIVEKRYKSGLATSLDVMDTQLALTMAKTNYLRALSDFVITKAALDKAVGL